MADRAVVEEAAARPGDGDRDLTDRGLAESVSSFVDELRPWLRGTFHRWAVPISVALSVILARRADTGGERAIVTVYGVCVTAMLGTSGVFHARRFAGRPRLRLRRLDHAMIHVGIAGTYTAVTMLGLTGATRVVLVVVAWTVAVAGVVMRMVWMDVRRGLVAAVYLVAGWQMLLDPPAYLDVLSGGQLALLAGGGVLYTIGAVLFALRWPDPWPRVFGFHEVWHTFVVAAAFLHWLAIFSLLG